MPVPRRKSRRAGGPPTALLWLIITAVCVLVMYDGPLAPTRHQFAPALVIGLIEGTLFTVLVRAFLRRPRFDDQGNLL